MALVTRCSNTACLTLFRVTPAQLQAFGGQVRCGTCSTVFDAFPSLATVADAALRTPNIVPDDPFRDEDDDDPSLEPSFIASTGTPSAPDEPGQRAASADEAATPAT
ncbi:MAG: hypothetical protein H7125_12870, partial [Proteobacteria bacterium]|nr:hypothetical protein [Burkholderiales bacterium]